MLALAIASSRRADMERTATTERLASELRRTHPRRSVGDLVAARGARVRRRAEAQDRELGAVGLAAATPATSAKRSQGVEAPARCAGEKVHHVHAAPPGHAEQGDRKVLGHPIDRPAAYPTGSVR
jgi:hypothetical protein